MSDAGKKHLIGLLCAGITLALGTAANATVIAQAEFTDGNGTSSADQWTGVAGGGWSTAWAVPVNQDNPAPMMSATIVNGAPLNGGGNYLSVANQPGAALTGPKQSHVTRGVDFASVENSAAVTGVSFTVRFDEFAGGADWLAFYDVTGSTYLNAPQTSWKVTMDNGFWGAFYASASNARTASNVALILGDTYTVDITLDYADGTYATTFTNLDWETGDAGTASATLSDLTLTSSTGFGEKFAIGARVAASATAFEALNYSLDAIEISTAAVPEPGTGLLALAGILTMAARRRRPAR